MRPRLVLAAMLACGLVAAAHAGTPSLSVGANDFSGTYGTSTTTDIYMVPLTFGYDTGKWHLKLTVPYIRISGSSNVIPGIGSVSNSNPAGRGRAGGPFGTIGGTGSTAPTTGTASGLGDIVAQASYTVFYDSQQRFGVDVGGKVKFGTADENKGLGTGKNDYGVTLDAYKGLGDWTLFGGLGYTRYGSSRYIPLHDGGNANVGASLRLDEGNTVGAYYYYRQRISDYGYRQSEVSGYWNHRFGDTMRLQVYALAGLSNGSPDFGGGASLKWRF